MVAEPPPPSFWFAGDVAWGFAGVAGYTASQWAAVVVMTRLTEPVTVGRYTLALAVSGPIVVCCGLALRTVKVSDPGARYGFRTYLTLRLVGMAVAVAVTALTGARAGGEAGLVLVAVGLAKAVDGVADIYHGLFQRHVGMRPVAVSLLLNGVLTVVLMTAALALTGSLPLAAAGSVLASAVTLLGWCRPTSRRYPCADRGRAATGSRDHGDLARLAVSAAPLALGSVATSLAANVPHYVVQHRWGGAALGVFAPLGYPALAAGLFFGAVAQAALPRLARSRSVGEPAELRRLTLRLIGVCAGLGAAGVGASAVVGRPLLAAVYGPAYAVHAPVFSLLMTAAAVGSTGYVLDAALAVTRRFASHLGAAVFGLAVCVASSALLIPYGLAGAALAVVATSVAQLGARLWLLRDVLRAGATTGDRARPALGGRR